MRKIHASKLFRKRGSKQKIHAPPKRKIHAKSMRKFMRRICALKFVRKRGSKQKIHAPQNEKSMQNPCGNSCAKFVRQSWFEKGAQNTKSMHPQNETNHARIHALILAPPSSEKGIAHATQLCNRKAGANEKAQPYGHLCSTSLSPRPWGQSSRPGDKLNWP